MRAVFVVACLAASGCRSGFDLLHDAGIADDDGDPGDGNPGGDAGSNRPNRVFITSTVHPATFGGVQAADDICQARADAASLGGTFIALIADETRPELRLTGSRGWVDLAGTAIVDEPATWLDGHMFHPLRLDETGADLGYVLAWVGSIDSCLGWTVTTSTETGSIVATNDAWGAYTVQNCNQQAHFVCVESGHVAPQSPPTVTGRLAFVTTANWTPNGGVASADSLCASEATAHSLPGFYLALLTTSSQDAFARFTLTGPPWTRIDGIPLTSTASELANGATTWLASFPHVRSDGTRYPYATTWTGSTSENCNNWMSASSGQSGRVGSAPSAYRPFWLSVFSAGCDIPRPITCLQK